MPFALSLLAGASVAAGLAAPAPSHDESSQVIPTRYEAGHFYAMPETADGKTLRLLVDTGGGGMGLYWLTGGAVKRLHLADAMCAKGKYKFAVARLPAYKPGQGLPLPRSACGNVVMVNTQVGAKDFDGDGLLGSGFLPGRVWTFDYPSHRLTLEGSRWRPDSRAHATDLGFPRDAKGQLKAGFARITVQVDSQPLDMLLDTGATAHPTSAGAEASGTPTVNGIGVASYITTSMLERWHRAHPGWRVVDKGDDLFGAGATRLIEVPKMGIAGRSVGPVWFTERPDRNFHDFMSSMMDKQVEGAIGGNVFGHFVMTIDYPGSTAYFRCVNDCTPVP